MPLSAHPERHFTGSEILRDIVIGMSDGLTVPFALAAGLSSATVNAHIIVTAGLAEIAAGSIAMGLGGYLAAKGEADHFQRELEREHREIVEVPEQEKHEVSALFREYGLRDDEIEPIVARLAERPTDWVKFMMRFELNIEQPDPKRAIVSALTIATSYVVGGLIPLSPYYLQSDAGKALLISVAITITALFIFGWLKGAYSGINPFRSAAQMTVIGGLAACAAFFIAKLISN